MGRNTGARFRAKPMQAGPTADREGVLAQADQRLAVTRALRVRECLSQQSKTIAKALTKRLTPPPADEPGRSGEGLGTIWAQTIGRETGDSGRFPPVGHSAADWRCVQRTHLRNGKRTGQGHGKNGHPYVAGASREAAQGALRCSPTVPRFSQRQHAQRHGRVARKAVAHTRARAGYSSMRDLGPFAGHQAFG
jgi:hypothetical protein